MIWTILLFVSSILIWLQIQFYFHMSSVMAKKRSFHRHSLFRDFCCWAKKGTCCIWIGSQHSDLQRHWRTGNQQQARLSDSSINYQKASSDKFKFRTVTWGFCKFARKYSLQTICNRSFIDCSSFNSKVVGVHFLTWVCDFRPIDLVATAYFS